MILDGNDKFAALARRVDELEAQLRGETGKGLHPKVLDKKRLFQLLERDWLPDDTDILGKGSVSGDRLADAGVDSRVLGKQDVLHRTYAGAATYAIPTLTNVIHNYDTDAITRRGVGAYDAVAGGYPVTRGGLWLCHWTMLAQATFASGLNEIYINQVTAAGAITTEWGRGSDIFAGQQLALHATALAVLTAGQFIQFKQYNGANATVNYYGSPYSRFWMLRLSA